MVELLGLGIVGGLGIGWVRRGSLSRLAAARLRLSWLVPVALALQMVMTRALGTDVPGWVLPVHALSYALLSVVILANRRRGGVGVLGAGLALNALVIFSNGGLMPQSPETLHVMHGGRVLESGQPVPRTKDIVLPREQTRLWWLSDVLTWPPGFPLRGVFSIGDVTLAAGLAWAIQARMRFGARTIRTVYAPVPAAAPLAARLCRP